MHLHSDRKIMGRYVANDFILSLNALKKTTKTVGLLQRCPSSIRHPRGCLSCTRAHDNYWAGAIFLLPYNVAHSIFYLHEQRNTIKIIQINLVCNPWIVFLTCLSSESVESNIFNLKLVFCFNYTVFMGFISPPSQPTSVRISSVLGDTKGRLIGPKLYFAPPTYYSIASFL